jgi:predicted phage terminase large subunit-like protein
VKLAGYRAKGAARISRAARRLESRAEPEADFEDDLPALPAAVAEPTPAAEMPTFRPQPGPQTAFLSSGADIVIYGGAAGGGKTFACLLASLKHRDRSDFHTVIFRRTGTAIRNAGGLWDASLRLFPFLGAAGSRAELRWTFPEGGTVKMSHLEHEDDRFTWQGTELPLIIFDELTHFTEKQFWYLLGRNRSTTGIRGRIRATCNPDPESFVAKLISWWIDQGTGFPIAERSGVVRWFVRPGTSDLDDELVWGDSRAELVARYPDLPPKSLTFIPAKVEDNAILLRQDPAYLANLKALSFVDRMRLEKGNWKVKPTAGTYFQSHWFGIVDALPGTRRKTVRYWDRAASLPNEKNPDPDWTAGVKVSYDGATFWIEDVVTMLARPFEVERAMLETARRDGVEVTIGLEQDPGSAGVSEIAHLQKLLSGFHTVVRKPAVDKETRAKPASSQAEASNVRLLRGPWNARFLAQLQSFPDGDHDDSVDAFSGAVNYLTEGITRQLATDDFVVGSAGRGVTLGEFIPRTRFR